MAFAERFGVPVTLLLFGIVALYLDWVVSGKRHRECCRQRDRLLSLALSGQRHTGTAISVAEALLPPVEGDSGGMD